MPHTARVYSYWLSGKDQYQADGEAAEEVIRCLPQGSCDYLDADLRDISGVLAGASATLDFTRPAAVLLAVLHFIGDGDDPATIVAALASRLAPGSYLVISHLTTDLAPGPVAQWGGCLQRLGPRHADRPHSLPGQRLVRGAAAGGAGSGPAHRMAASHR